MTKAPDLMSWRCPNTWLSPLHYVMLQDSNWIPQPAKPGELPVTDPGYTPLAWWSPTREHYLPLQSPNSPLLLFFAPRQLHRLRRTAQRQHGPDAN